MAVYSIAPQHRASGTVVLQNFFQTQERFGHRRMRLHERTAKRMDERQRDRMQRLAIHACRLAPVESVADQRMPQIAQVHTNLMRPAGIELAGDLGCVRILLDQLVMGAQLHAGK